LEIELKRTVPRAHDDYPTTIRFGPKGTQLATVGRNDETVKLWDAATGESSGTLDTEVLAFSVAYRHDGLLLAIGGRGTIQLWDLALGQRRKTLRNQATTFCARFSPDGKTLATADSDNKVRLWDLATGEPTHILAGHRKGALNALLQEVDDLIGGGCVWAVAYHPSGKSLASAGADGTVRIWAVDAGKCTSVFRGNRLPVYALAYAPDGTRIAFGGGDSNVRVWNLQQHAAPHVLKGHEKFVDSLAYLPGGQYLVSGGNDGTIRVWDTHAGNCVRTLKHGDGKVSVTVDSKGQTLASAGEDNALKFWAIRKRPRAERGNERFGPKGP
jgi:WD40 repeat protein